MQKIIFRLFLPLLFVLLLAGCKKEKTRSPLPGHEPAAVPAAPQYTAVTDTSVPPLPVEIEKALTDSARVRLSEVAARIDYYPVGDDRYPVTQVEAISEGLITFSDPRTYLSRTPGKKRKRIGFKAAIPTIGHTATGRSFYYDPQTTRLHYLLNYHGEKIEDDRLYIAVIPPLDSMLARRKYLFPDSVPDRYYLRVKEPLLDFTSSGYTLRTRHPRHGMPDGVATFNLRGDTLCRFPVGVDRLPDNVEPSYFKGLFFTAYRFEDRLTFKLYFCDTVYRLSPPDTIRAAYVLNWGNGRASAVQRLTNTELTGKTWLESWVESPAALFMGVFKKGLEPGEGWLDEPADPTSLSARHRLVYLKKKGQTVALPAAWNGLQNDLDGGLPFWPDGQAGGILYMVRSAGELRAYFREPGRSCPPALKVLLDKLEKDQLVMITAR